MEKTRPFVQFFVLEPGSLWRVAPSVQEAYDPECVFKKGTELEFVSRMIVSSDTAHEHPTPIRVKIWNKGRRWTDFLAPHFSHAPSLCSQRVVDVIRAEKLKGIRILPVTLEPRIKSRPIDPPCAYYWMIPTGKPLPFYIKAYHSTPEGFTPWFTAEDNSDPRLHAWLTEKTETPDRRHMPVIEKWDGNNLIPWTAEDPVGSMGKVYCSRRFIEVAYREKWTNLRAGPMDQVGCTAGMADLSTKPWPPELWYSDKQPWD